MPFNCVFKVGRTPWEEYKKGQPLDEDAQCTTVWECTRIADGVKVAIKTIYNEHRIRFERRTIPALKRMVTLSDDALAHINAPFAVFDNHNVYWEVKGLGKMTLTYYMGQKGPWLKVLGNKVKNYHKVLRDIMNGVDGLHSIDVAHGDLKPDNILITATGAKITDWGHVLPTFNQYKYKAGNSCIQMMKEILLCGILSDDPLLPGCMSVPGCISPKDSDQYKVGCLIVRMCIGERAYKLLWNDFLHNGGNYQNAVVGFENMNRCIKLLRDKLSGKEEWTLVVKYLGYMSAGINCKGNEFHEMNLWAQRNKDHEKRYVNTIGKDIMIKLLDQMEQISKNGIHDIEAYNVKNILNGYVSNKLKNVGNDTLHKIKTYWNEQKEDNHRKIMVKYLLPNYLDLHQIDQMEDIVENEIEKLINNLLDAPDNNTNINENANAINGYTIVRGAKFTAEQQRHNPMSGLPPNNYECKQCGTVGKHWIQNCPMK